MLLYSNLLCVTCVKGKRGDDSDQMASRLLSQLNISVAYWSNCRLPNLSHVDAWRVPDIYSITCVSPENV